MKFAPIFIIIAISFCYGQAEDLETMYKEKLRQVANQLLEKDLGVKPLTPEEKQKNRDKLKKRLEEKKQKEIRISWQKFQQSIRDNLKKQAEEVIRKREYLKRRARLWKKHQAALANQKQKAINNALKRKIALKNRKVRQRKLGKLRGIFPNLNKKLRKSATNRILPKSMAPINFNYVFADYI